MPIDSGILDGDHSGLPRAAGGYYLLEDGMHQASGMARAILNGVVVLRM